MRVDWETVTTPQAKGSWDEIELPEPNQCDHYGGGVAQWVVWLCRNAATAGDAVPQQKEWGTNTRTPLSSHYLISYYFYPFTKSNYKPTGKGTKNMQSIGVNILGHKQGLGRVKNG